MQTVTRVGIDIAKSVVQVHGIDATGHVVIGSPAEAPLCADVLPETAVVRGWHRGLCVVASLVARAQGTGPYRAVDAAGLC